MFVLLGEVGGVEECCIVEAVKQGDVAKLIVASGTREAWRTRRRWRQASVPEAFEELPRVLKEAYQNLVEKGTVVPKAEMDLPVVPVDHRFELGLICKPVPYAACVIDNSHQTNKFIGCIRHKIKSLNNPDLRTAREALILNINNCISICSVDLLCDSGTCMPDEADWHAERSFGFIGRHLDQQAPLYRHPVDNILINVAAVAAAGMLSPAGCCSEEADGWA
ncbi:hypothetical protein C8R45DRAFT_1103561 [Mycena sanguinolenta]|nr:hypothetical protein C8R45DRAFT_1103561 [Mycena sanguinolenta]